jgi:hypothetical protein
MKNPGRLSFFVLSISLLCAVGSVCRAEDSSTVRAAIEQAGVRFAEAYGRGDAKAVAAFYTEDAIAFPPGAAMVKGRQAIQQMWQETMDSGVKSLSFTGDRRRCERRSRTRDRNGPDEHPARGEGADDRVREVRGRLEEAGERLEAGPRHLERPAGQVIADE